MNSSSVIRELQMEITNYCQARCPGCAREKSQIKRTTSPYHYELNTKYITFDEFKNWFNKDDWKMLRLVDFCGNYDEATTNPDLLKIIDWLLSDDLFSKDLVVNVATNGGTRNVDFWKDMANLCKKYRVGKRHSRLRVVWGIDGLEDTNHIYRYGLSWDNIWNNLTSYCNAGGYAQWDFLVWEHNWHQIPKVKQICNNLGVKHVEFKITRQGTHRQQDGTPIVKSVEDEPTLNTIKEWTNG